MLKTYFFIPATQKRFIEKMPDIQADEFVLDLEDAIAANNIETAFENLEQLDNIENLIIRPRLYSKSGKLKDKNLERLIDLGFHRFFIPKANTPEMLDELLNIFKYYDVIDLQWYFLVESPTALMYLKELALSKKYPFKGLCLGSQDYAAEMGMSYSLEQIDWARRYVLNIAKACNIEAIDIASMVIKDRQLFEKEAASAFQMGYDSKLVIHPAQLNVLQEIDYYTRDEIDHAKELNQKADINDMEAFSAISIDGVVYERPHIKRVKKIIDYLNKQNQKE